VVARCEVLARTRKLRSTDAGATQPLTDDERRHLAAKGQWLSRGILRQAAASWRRTLSCGGAGGWSPGSGRSGGSGRDVQGSGRRSRRSLCGWVRPWPGASGDPGFL